jgi:glycosyltransferase involved in cell wall biosynthesis
MGERDLLAEGGQRLRGIFRNGSAEQPLVSVVTATFNAHRHLAGCLDSVILQDYPNIEHIVMDGGSSDGTLNVLQQYDDALAFWKREPDDGVFDAWNKALDEARGEWICFLGADDVFLPGAISAYMALARRCPEAEFLSSRARLEHATGYSPEFGGPWAWPQFSKAMTTVHVGSMHRRALFQRLGRFDKNYRIAGDYEFMLRARNSLRAAFMPEVSVVMRAGGLSDSAAGLYEAKRAKLQHSVCGLLRAELDLRQLIIRFYLRKGYLQLRARVLRYFG